MMAVTGAGTTVEGDGAGVPDPRLKPAAHEFEACLMKEFLAPLQHDALFDDSKDGGSDEDNGNALTSFGTEALARAISERGGLGIATKILAHFEPKSEPAGGGGTLSQEILRMGGKMGLKE